VFGCADTSALNQDELEYFSEIAFGAEFGDVDPRILKWNEDVRIRIIGNFTEVDWTSVESVVSDLNRLIKTPDLKIVDKNQNVSMYFAPESTFAEIEPSYIPTNYGFFWTNWYDDNFELYSATILIASDHINQEERSHLIREELTQCLGLMNDSEKYSNSMFFQGWTKTQDFSSLDKKVIRALYQSDIKSGMTRTEALALLTVN
jgi:AAA+ ATPase superfamily predicted ATPase